MKSTIVPSRSCFIEYVPCGSINFLSPRKNKEKKVWLAVTVGVQISVGHCTANRSAFVARRLISAKKLEDIFS